MPLGQAGPARRRGCAHATQTHALLIGALLLCPLPLSLYLAQKPCGVTAAESEVINQGEKNQDKKKDLLLRNIINQLIVLFLSRK